MTNHSCVHQSQQGNGDIGENHWQGKVPECFIRGGKKRHTGEPEKTLEILEKVVQAR
jgi:hypothetical protein